MPEIAITVVIVLFGYYTWSVGRAVGGYRRFVRSILSTGPGRQVTIDLYIATTILCVLMVYDAIEVGISLAWVSLYILIAVFMASFGPLLYLLHRFIVT